MASNFVNGSVKIADEILDQIANAAASDVYGVISEDQGHNLLNKNPKSRVTKNGEKLHFRLTVNLENNVKVVKTVKDIQSNVKNVVENMTGLSVDKVDVNVENLEIIWEGLSKENGSLD